METNKQEIIRTAINANLDVLLLHTSTVTEAISVASADMEDGNQNAAIGGLLQLEEVLTEMVALYSSIIALHRQVK